MFRKNKQNKSNNRASNKDSAKKPNYSYYQSRDKKNKSDDSRTLRSSNSPSRLKRFSQNFIALASAFVILISIAYAISLGSKPKLVVINKDADQLVQKIGASTQDYSKSIEEILNQSIYSKTKITADVGELQNQIIDASSEIKDAAISIPIFGRSPIVYLQLYEPVAVISSNNTKFLLSENGKAIKQAEKNDTGYLQITDESGLGIEEGSQVLTDENVDFILRIKQQLKDKKISIKKIKLPRLANEMHVSLNKSDYDVKFSFSADPRLQAGTFLATQKDLAEKNITPTEYIDVRVEERAYYK